MKNSMIRRVTGRMVSEYAAWSQLKSIINEKRRVAFACNEIRSVDWLRSVSLSPSPFSLLTSSFSISFVQVVISLVLFCKSRTLLVFWLLRRNAALLAVRLLLPQWLCPDGFFTYVSSVAYTEIKIWDCLTPWGSRRRRLGVADAEVVEEWWEYSLPSRGGLES